jgi:hypothetical protein
MPNIKVLVIESSAPGDFFNDQLDGPSTLQLLNLLGLNAKLRYAINDKTFRRALKEAAADHYNIIHLSCHGNMKGFFLTDGTKQSWDEFAQAFQEYKLNPNALVMSACCGASSGIGNAFEIMKLRPEIIFGSTTAQYYDEYAVAWAILYRTFLNEDVTRDAAQQALAYITAVVHSSFRYRRWDDDKERYLSFPSQSSQYGVVDLNQLTRKERKRIDVI